MTETEQRGAAPAGGGASAFLSRLDQGEKIILAATLLAAILCVLPWYSVSIEGDPQFKELMEGSEPPSKAGLSFWQGVLTFLLALASAGALWGDKSGALKLEPKIARLVPLAGCGGGALFTLIYLLSADTASGNMFVKVSAGPTLWAWAALLALGAGAFFAFRRWAAVATAPEA